MSHFAKVKNGKVLRVIVAEQDFIDSYNDGIAGSWIQTSYNTYGGVHINGGTPLRYNFATVGGNYDKLADAFYSNQPYDSWTLNTDTYIWEAPVALPDDAVDNGGDTFYKWNEETQSWDAVETE